MMMKKKFTFATFQYVLVFVLLLINTAVADPAVVKEEEDDGPAEPVPFECTGEAYYSKSSPAKLYKINLDVMPFKIEEFSATTTSGAEVILKGQTVPTKIEINGMGYRRTDNMIYALALAPVNANYANKNGNYGIIKIDSLGQIFHVATSAQLGIPGIGSFNYRFPAGDVSPDGNYMYISDKRTSDTFKYLYKVNLNTLGVAERVTKTGYGQGGVNVADWAVNPIDGMLYGADAQSSPAIIWQLNPDTGKMSVVPGSSNLGLARGITSNDAYGGAWFNHEGILHLYRNIGEVYIIRLRDDSGEIDPQVLRIDKGGETSAYSDAAACATEPTKYPSIDIQETVCVERARSSSSSSKSESESSSLCTYETSKEWADVADGDDVYWFLKVTNTGDLTLDITSFTDTLDPDPILIEIVGGEGDEDNDDSILKPGEYVIYKYVAEVTDETFPSDGLLVNEACVTAETTTTQEEVTDCDDAAIFRPAVCVPEPDADDDGSVGCTSGFWRQDHNQYAWDGLSPSYKRHHTFAIVFDVQEDSDLTLQDALSSWGVGGGWGGRNMYSLRRQATAALLNSASLGLNYEFTTAEVKEMVQNVYDTGLDPDLVEETTDAFEEQNEMSCPL